MAADEKWYFTKDQLANTPSRKCGIDADKELSYRQQAANFIQDMGQRLSVTQLCINTAIVYMHRFYVFHSLSQFHRNAIAAAALFLAAKVEEQPRKLEHVIKVAHMCLHREQIGPETKPEQYIEQAQDLVFNENVLLQTLGFDVAIDHPHTHVVRCCHLVKASKDLAQTSYFMASNSLHLTTMCLQYKPAVVACFCIHLACKWSNWEIPQSNEGKRWFWYVDPTVTAELLQQLTAEFLHIFDKCPSRLKKKIMSISEKQSPSMHHPSLPNSPFDLEPRKVQSPAPDGGPMFQSSRPFPTEEDKKKSSSMQQRPPVDMREYREKKERERLEREKLAGTSGASSVPSHGPHHSHHKQPSSSATSSTTSSSLATTTAGKHQAVSNQKTNIHHNHHHRPDLKLQPPVQRHSSTSQARDPSRQRIPRDYNSVQASGPHPAYQHVNLPKDVNPSAEGSSSIDSVGCSSESGTLHPNLAEKLTNNNNNNNHHHGHRAIQHEKRAFDPRQKIMEHRKETQEQKTYGKYTEQRQRKPDSLEQRSEEVRKLIDKPLPLPKPRAEVHKEEYIANMLKQSHHPKYGEDKITGHNFPRNLVPPDFPKLSSTLKPPTGPAHSHGVTAILKDMKNGNSNAAPTPVNSMDDPKAEKRPRVEEPIAQVVPQKHKSLFSPESVSSSREPHLARSKPARQKTPLASVKTIKQDRAPEVTLQTVDLISSFANATAVPSSQITANQNQKRNRTTSFNENEAKAKIEEPPSDLMKMLTGRMPELLPPIRDPPRSTNGRPSIPPNDFKLPEPQKYGDIELLANTRHNFTNGLDMKKLEALATESLEQSLQMKNNDYLSPLKSAQSISALLQEPLAPMPSLLHHVSDDSGCFSQPSQGHESGTLSMETILQTQETQMIHDNFVLSTVDISALSAPMQTIPEVSIPVANNPVVENKKSEHHKSEKKKKKEKHKHKDKSKEKHKHKHKDKDKEKHRDKDKDKEREKDKERSKDRDKTERNDETSTAPIKITIPKDKLNLSSESTMTDKTSPPSTGLKIKIPKDRLKEATTVPPVIRDIQAPLKIKIRTSTAMAEYPESRKRERDPSDSVAVPPSKKSQLSSGVAAAQTFANQQPKANERQNGRHYSSSSNNKEKHSSREHKSSSKSSQSQQSHTT